MDLGRGLRWRGLVSFVVFVVFFLGSTLATIRFLVQSGDDVPVPSLIGLSEREGAERLSLSNLRLDVTGGLHSDAVPPGTILQQSIAPNERVREGRSVGVLVSKGPRPRTVPRLIGLGTRALSVVLGSSGLTPGRSVRSCSEEIPAGIVMGQDPPPGKSITGDRVDFLISSGSCFDRFVLEDFTGAPYETTLRKFKEKGFSVAVVRQEAEEAPEGSILEQEPSSGTLISVRDPIRFKVASRALVSTVEGGRLVLLSVPSPPAFFRKVGNLRLERGEPAGSATIDFLLTPGNNSEFVLWLSPGSEVFVTVNGEEVSRKMRTWP